MGSLQEGACSPPGDCPFIFMRRMPQSEKTPKGFSSVALRVRGRSPLKKGRRELAHHLETAHSFSCGECRKARKPQKGFRAWPFGAEGQEKAPWGGRRARKSL